jgi:hypothetical protein
MAWLRLIVRAQIHEGRKIGHAWNFGSRSAYIAVALLRSEKYEAYQLDDFDEEVDEEDEAAESTLPRFSPRCFRALDALSYACPCFL